MKRREFLKAAGWFTLAATGCAPALVQRSELYVNDVHSQLNRTRVAEILRPRSVHELRLLVLRARREGQALSVAGGRHAMGTQQFATDSIHVDTRGLARVLGFDRERGLLEVEAGIQWPDLVRHYLAAQQGEAEAWGFAQKQTGGDRFTIGGTLAANAHGRGLTRRPFIADVESLVVMDADGDLRRCSRRENAELFRLVIGGYGMFGIVTSATLRLVPRRKVERIVETLTVDELPAAFQRRIDEGFLYGDLQFSIDDTSDDYLRRGVFSCYRPADPARPIPEAQKQLSEDQWRELLYLAHADKRAGFERYASYYRTTSGQLYWSDTHQMSAYFDDYHVPLDRRLGAPQPATEMITEIYVPVSRLADAMSGVREDFRRQGVDLIYGTIRRIEKDEESFLPWAREAYLCIIFNLHVVHTPERIAAAAVAFRSLIDRAIEHGGSFYLTYHRWAERRQIEACYPRFAEALILKRRYDPQARFRSDWWSHHARMFGVT